MGKRDARILELLTEHERLEVAQLARELGVSSVTMRKDLDDLESRDVIRREHGYAGLVASGETVMVESGSCCALLAQELASASMGVTMVTNSAFIAGYVRREPGAKTILLGGTYQNDAQVNVGPMVAQSAKNFCVDRLFIGVDGYMPNQGFTNSDQMRAQAVLDMAAQAQQVIVLTESDKFSRHGVVPMRLSGKIACVVTDDGLDPHIAQAVQGAGVRLICVPRED